MMIPMVQAPKDAVTVAKKSPADSAGGSDFSNHLDKKMAAARQDKSNQLGTARENARASRRAAKTQEAPSAKAKEETDLKKIQELEKKKIEKQEAEKKDMPLFRERMGHSLLEVSAGAVWGIVLTYYLSLL